VRERWGKLLYETKEGQLMFLSRAISTSDIPHINRPQKTKKIVTYMSVYVSQGHKEVDTQIAFATHNASYHFADIDRSPKLHEYVEQKYKTEYFAPRWNARVKRNYLF